MAGPVNRDSLRQVVRSPFQAGKELRKRHFEMPSNGENADDGQVSFASFDTAHVGPVQTTDVRKFLLRPSSLRSKLTNTLTQRLLNGFVLRLRFSFCTCSQCPRMPFKSSTDPC